MIPEESIFATDCPVSSLRYPGDFIVFPDGCAVYKIVHVVSGECYVGSSQDVRRRLYSAIRKLRIGTHHSKLLQKKFSDHGDNEFAVVILETPRPGRLGDCERKWFVELKPIFNANVPSRPDVRPEPCGFRSVYHWVALPAVLTGWIRRRADELGMDESEVIRACVRSAYRRAARKLSAIGQDKN